MEVKQKAKRVIKKFDFSTDGCAVSLVGPSVGGGANGKTTLLTKASAPKVSDEFIKKASQVKVTMEITEFLSKLFGIWYEDAEVLARALGFTTATQDYKEANPSTYEDYYEDYIEEQVKSIEVMKSLYKAENIADVLAELDGPQYLGFVQDQAKIEKAFCKIERLNKSTDKVIKESKPTVESVVDDTSFEVKEGVSPIVKQTNKEKQMDENEKMVELQKSFEDNKILLTKALEQVKALESEKKEQVVKSKTAKITELVKDETHAKIIAKACLELESEEDFTAFVAAISAMTSTIDKTDMFIEKGLQVDNIELQPTESAVMKAVKARIAKAAK